MAWSITTATGQGKASRISLICFLLILSHDIVVDSAFTVVPTPTTLTVSIGNTEIIHHSEDSPFLYTGNAEADIDELHGNFQIDEYLVERFALTDFTVDEKQFPEYTEYNVSFSRNGEFETIITLGSSGDQENVITFSQTSSEVNRYWVRFVAEENEHVYGGGEQFSYFDLRGNEFPIWTREQGVGRNKSTITTFNADNSDGGGGDYHTTYFPQPTFVSSRKYYCHFDTTVYSVLNFRPSDFHEVEIWSADPGKIYFDTAGTMLELVQKLGGFLGRQPQLPEWVIRGATLGIQGGTDAMLAYVDQAKEYGIELSAMWIQDWAGRITTSFGSRLFWNWKWNETQYPNLKEEIQTLKDEGIGVLAYVNPYLNIEGDLFAEGDAQGFFVNNTAGETYIADFGEFFCGTVDFTNPDAYNWYKEEVLKKNMIELGLSGWMADFGEYLPVKDVVLHSGEDAEVMHNEWPAIWARMNKEAVEESGKLGEIVYWMRAGYTGSQEYSTIMWAGDQFVDFSRGDGLPSTIPAALSMAMIGCGMTHFDIGGYTALYGYSRSEELLLRSAEMAVFTPMMRTHEGNRPLENWQYYSSDSTLRQFARLTQLHHDLTEYTKFIVSENVNSSIPVQRPLFLHYEDDEETYGIAYQYLYGRDLLVAPVAEEGRDTWRVYLPADDWVYLWDNKEQQSTGEYFEVDAPIGYPPVYYRKSSDWVDLFKQLSDVTVNPAINTAPGTTRWAWPAYIVMAIIVVYLFTGY